MLRTTQSQPLEVIDLGIHNTNAGPDFLNAKIKIGSTIWVGHVEIHVASSDWYKHQHHHNPAYDMVVLHVVQCADKEVFNSRGESIPQLEISVPSYIRDKYESFQKNNSLFSCKDVVKNLPRLIVHAWLDALCCERLEQRAEQVYERLRKQEYNWEGCLFVTLARNFGFGLNGDVFESWAYSIPFHAIEKHRDNLLQVEALFLGQAGLLDERCIAEKNKAAVLSDAYYNELKREYAFLARKFNLNPIPYYYWKFLRIRPASFPHRRIAQLAYLYHSKEIKLSNLLEMDSINDINKLITLQTSNYWKAHTQFGISTRVSQSKPTSSTMLLIALNTVVPIIYAFGKYRLTDLYKDKAYRLLQGYPAENNSIIRSWEQCGIKPSHAADSQALIHLKKEYCEKKKCLQCRFGYEVLRGRFTIVNESTSQPSNYGKSDIRNRKKI